MNQNGDERMEPASLTKLMTAYLAFDALKHGTLALEQNLTVPAAAVRNIQRRIAHAAQGRAKRHRG